MSQNIGKPRVNFASIKNPLPYPDFLEVQLKSFKDFLQLDTPPEKRKNEGLYKVFAENFPIADTRNNFVLEFSINYIRSAPLHHRWVFGARTYIQCASESETQALLHRPRSRRFRHRYTRCLPRSYSLYDRKRYICNQWCRTCCCVSVAPFSRRVLRTEYPRQWNETLFGENYSLQRFVDRVCYRHQQCDVCLYRS